MEGSRRVVASDLNRRARATGSLVEVICFFNRPRSRNNLTLPPRSFREHSAKLNAEGEEVKLTIPKHVTPSCQLLACKAPFTESDSPLAGLKELSGDGEASETAGIVPTLLLAEAPSLVVPWTEILSSLSSSLIDRGGGLNGVLFLLFTRGSAIWRSLPRLCRDLLVPDIDGS